MNNNNLSNVNIIMITFFFISAFIFLKNVYLLFTQAKNKNSYYDEI